MVMKKIIYIFTIFALIVGTSCSEIEREIGIDEVKGVSKTFVAKLEKGDLTKTTLDGELGDPIRKIMWSANDSIMVACLTPEGWTRSNPFVNTSSESSEETTFTGTIDESSEYYSLYPYANNIQIGYRNYYDYVENTWKNRYYFQTIIPSTQCYQEESFAPRSFPMMAKTSCGERLEFKNLFGIMVLNLTGEETIRSIKFTAKNSQDRNATLCGPVLIPFDFPDSLATGNDVDGLIEFISTDDPSIHDPSIITDAITLDCGEEGVALDSETPTRFYFVLPPATYHGFTVAITTTDGKTMFKQGKNDLTIKRSNVSKTGALEYMENISIDLSLRGTSNCYVVSEPGYYSFDATTIGNGEFGILTDKGFHTETTTIKPDSVEVLWQDYSTIISDVTLDAESGRISFSATGSEGNALIVAKDGEGTIIWSWHIWATDKPQDHRYSSGYTFMDRNLGAIRNSRGSGNDWLTSSGTVYQWGRKDPFMNGNHTSQSESVSMEYSIQNPTLNIYTEEWLTPSSSDTWDENQKTIYDPCPVGYRVPPSGAWNGITTNNENWNSGNNIVYDGTNTAWYPGTKYGYWGVPHNPSQDNVYMWSSTRPNNDTQPSDLRIFSYSNSKDISTHFPGVGMEIRCIVDDGYKDIAVPHIFITGITEITPNSINLNCRIEESALAPTLSKGIILNHGAEEEFIIESDSEESEFTITLSDLTPSTTYRIKAFAINEHGTTYTEDIPVTTLSEHGESIDLSADGTANSYIVSSYGTYSFDCTVKGNTTESVGKPRTAVVLWETKNTTMSIGQGEIISEVTLEGGRVIFKPTMQMTPGNALIAVKDKSGAIIWSWHIWVVNFDPEATAQEYPSGVLLMDRNLGALSTDEGNAQSYGMLYQWGRKDPFIGSAEGSSTLATTYPADIFTVVNNSSEYNNLDYATANPAAFIQSSSWNYSSSNYWNDSKGIHDPCPPGWRVPDGYPHVWTGADLTPFSYPHTGYFDYWHNLYNVGSSGNFWTCHTNHYVSIQNGKLKIYSIASEGYGYSIRCMKDARFTIGAVNMNTIGSVNAILSASLSVEDNTEIEVKGFVLSTSQSDPHIFMEDAIIVYAEDGSAGDYSVYVENLTPHTTYYVRAFATGGHNTRYSTGTIFTTKHAASDDDGFTMDDFEW